MTEVAEIPMEAELEPDLEQSLRAPAGEALALIICAHAFWAIEARAQNPEQTAAARRYAKIVTTALSAHYPHILKSMMESKHEGS